MTSEIIPFPLAKRQAFIQRHARYAASIRPDAAECYLERQSRHQTSVLLHLGIAEGVVVQEVRSARRAIDIALWEAVLRPPAGGAV